MNSRPRPFEHRFPAEVIAGTLVPAQWPAAARSRRSLVPLSSPGPDCAERDEAQALAWLGIDGDLARALPPSLARLCAELAWTCPPATGALLEAQPRSANAPCEDTSATARFVPGLRVTVPAPAGPDRIGRATWSPDGTACVTLVEGDPAPVAHRLRSAA